MTPKIESILDQRLPVRFDELWTEESKDRIMELAETVHDRLCLRLNCSEDEFPLPFVSVLIDATSKAWNRLYYEGINSENVSDINNSFFEDILNEYSTEIEGYKDANGASTGKVVRFK